MLLLLYNNSVFIIKWRRDKNMIEEVIKLYKEKTKKDCYKIEIEEGVTPDILDDKIGGIPYLPVGEEYPVDKNNNPMILLIQINLENIKLENYPQEGILEIFIDKECSWPLDYKIKYFKNISEYRTDLTEIDFKNDFYKQPLKIKLTKDVEHMPLSDYRFADVMSETIKEATGIEVNNYSEVEDFFEKNGYDMYDEIYKLNIFPGNLSGYADFTQEDPRPIKNAEDRVECFIKIDSNLGHGIVIGDSGIIFSFISKEDIKSRNFENAIVDWDCC